MLTFLYLAVFCTIIGYYGWYRGIRNIGAAKTYVFNYINPLVAAAVSHFIFNEKFSVYTAAGTALVLTGVFMGSSINSMIIIYGEHVFTGVAGFTDVAGFPTLSGQTEKQRKTYIK